MISVGVDIDRLGLMVVAGQPKEHERVHPGVEPRRTTSEQAGLVVTVFNLHKPRDRSHYERFAAYHASFYRFVEATSLTRSPVRRSTVDSRESSLRSFVCSTQP